ncbi:DNA-binding protein WhiA [Alkalicella caledoniensis]|uniref:Probable cell division protein WhiA n=1 Tax=Alkalicella caledoniensis TaxID=2731377 RepID=A0A7G9W6T3_ALKCA|nr:DNA-binding protein WhiA [Alkalicella caledoniensis]QNO14395.1 DNA-binding protein WhiA [Alkalicella caledoniensis]
MSFASDIKSELCRIKSHDCCIKSELAALFLINGTVQINSKGMVLNVTTENATIAKRIYTLIKDAFSINGSIFVKRKTRLKKNNSYLVEVSGKENVENLLDILHLLGRDEGVKERIHKMLLRKKCCKRAFIRGSFLAAGSVNNPDSTTYHCEINVGSQNHCEYLVDLCKHFEIPVKSFQRRSHYVLYLKDSDDIVDFLNVIGAHNALLTFENARVYKEMRNQVNRVVNCETANLNKIVDASHKQVEQINYIEETIGLNSLPQSLIEVALERLNDPSLSLKELGERLNPPVGKSGINHRLKRIEKIADEIRTGKYKQKNKKG